jgi:hypothetical protein
MRKTFIYILILLIGLMAGCSNSSEGAYAAILFIDGKKYYGQKIVNKDQYTIQDEIGKVKFKVDKDTVPKQNFSSNSLEVGTPIYRVKEDKNILLVKLSEEKYQIFSEKAIGH